MTVKKRSKVVKQRGQRTHGYGSPKKHRGAGNRGGRGLAGSAKHRKTYILKYDPDHFGEKGFKSKTGKNMKTINLQRLAVLAGAKKEVDVTALGYDKVLGKGKLSVALNVKADHFSAIAKEKIEQAGGKVIGQSVPDTSE